MCPENSSGLEVDGGFGGCTKVVYDVPGYKFSTLSELLKCWKHLAPPFGSVKEHFRKELAKIRDENIVNSSYS